MDCDICIIAFRNVNTRINRQALSFVSEGWRVVVAISDYNNSTPSEEHVNGYTILRADAPKNNYTILRDKTLATISYSLVYLIWLFGAIRPFKDLLWHLQLHAKWYQRSRHRGMMKIIPKIHPRLIIAHDYTAMITLDLYKPDVPIIYDAVELFFDRQAPKKKYPFYVKHRNDLERIYQKKLVQNLSVGIMSSSEGISHQFNKEFNVPLPLTIFDAVDMRIEGNVAYSYETGGRKTIVHSGGLYYGRQLHEMVEALVYLPDDVALVLMGDGPLKEDLSMWAQEKNVDHRFFIFPPVNHYDIAQTLSQADAAAILITREGLSYEYSQPNKFFEAIAAGLPIVTGPNKGTANFMREYGLGIICHEHSNPQAIAGAFDQILEPSNQAKFRENVIRAQQIFNWENEEKKMINFIRPYLGN